MGETGETLHNYSLPSKKRKGAIANNSRMGTRNKEYGKREV